MALDQTAPPESPAGESSAAASPPAESPAAGAPAVALAQPSSAGAPSAGAPSVGAPSRVTDPPLPAPGEDDAAAVRGPDPGALDDGALDRLFRTARTPESWREGSLDDALLEALYDLVKFGPTSGNCSPGRFMFLRSAYARERLRPSLSEGNRERAMAAPAVVIVAHDPRFFDDLPRLQPGADARDWFANNEDLAAVTAFRNGTLQGAYLIMAARALGLDCLPMSGFDNEAVDREFLLATGWKSNFLVCLGHAAAPPASARAPRLGFAEACRIL